MLILMFKGKMFIGCCLQRHLHQIRLNRVHIPLLLNQHTAVDFLLSLRMDLTTNGFSYFLRFYFWKTLHIKSHLTFFYFLGLIRLRSNPPPKLQGVEYILNITATDDNASGGPQSLSATAQVIVGVDDVNNNKPIFEKVSEFKFKYLAG